MRRSFCTLAAAAWLARATAFAQDAAPAAPLVEWNERVLAMAEAEDGLLTLKGVRTAAMMHIAVHDALAAAGGPYAPYLPAPSAPRANPVVAAITAACAVAADQYPGQADALRRLRDAQLGALPRGESFASGLAAGEAAARAILAARKGDGWDREVEYRWHPMAPGVYAEFNEHSGTPAGFVFGAGWARVRPFALEKPDQFRAPPPPAIDSEAYARAFDEVKEVGRFQSMTRTPDQTHLALWWKDFAESSHNRLARDLAIEERLDLPAAARLFALLNIAIHDAYVSVFDNKFHYNFWRPYTAIRWAHEDGNPATAREATWTNTHRHTYAFPSYPSAHGTACAAAMTVIADTFGEKHAFTMRTPQVDVAGPGSGKIEMHPPTRSFASPAEAATECALSRVYLGIHFRFDSTAGVDLGQRVGGYVTGRYLQRRGGRPPPPVP